MESLAGIGKDRGRAGVAASQSALAGVIASTPTLLTQSVKVRLHGDPARLAIEAIGWRPMITTDGEVVFPDVGDDCVVVFDDRRDVWIQQWTPNEES